MKTDLNIILVGIDTLRADRLGAYGNVGNSPNIDAMAGTGVLFENCFSQAPATAPSFMSIFTSLYPSYHGVLDNIGATGTRGRSYALDESVPTMTEFFKRSGFRTAAFTDGGNLYDGLGFAKGFDFYSMNRGYGHAAAIIPEKDIFYWLQEYSREQFFLFIHTYAVHSPWNIPAQYHTADYNNILPVDSKHVSDQALFMVHFQKELREYMAYVSQSSVHDPKIAELMSSLYNDAIRYVDDFMGNLMETLKQLNINRQTVVIFTSDHGEEFLDHGMLSHKQLYNEILRVPLIFHAPAFDLKGVICSIARSIDIFPTIAELLELPLDIEIHGESLMPMVREQKHSDRIAIAEAETYGFSVQDQNFKYIYPRYKNYSERTDELYDLLRDPREKQNIFIGEEKTANQMRNIFETELHSRPRIKTHKKIIHLL